MENKGYINNQLKQVEGYLPVKDDLVEIHNGCRFVVDEADLIDDELRLAAPSPQRKSTNRQYVGTYGIGECKLIRKASGEWVDGYASRKVVQLIPPPLGGIDFSPNTVVALCDDGTMWALAAKEPFESWQPLPPIPQDDQDQS